MNVRLTFRIQGGLLIFLGGMLLTPIAFSLYFDDDAFWAFLLSALAALASGAIIYLFLPARGEITHREGFAIVTFGWFGFALFGSLPYLLSGCIPNPVDAFFESMSGFSTTGATVLPLPPHRSLDELPRSILFWRALTQWLGGMGIIVLSLAILPFLGVGGMQLFEAEAPGPTADRLSPRIQDTAKVLWGVYFLITFAEVILLWLGEMNFYEALCHSLTTMATGGFSTRDGSIGEFNSVTQVIVTLFMLLAGVNFSLHYRALRGEVGGYWKSEEFRFYVSVFCFATLLIASLSIFDDYLASPTAQEQGALASPEAEAFQPYSSTLTNLRDAAFQTSAIVTTTGFGTADYETWRPMAQYVLVALMFLGGCAGSTGGGMKVARVMLLVKHAYLQLSRLIHPREVRLLKLDHKPVSPEVIRSILGFFALYISLFLVASLLMAGILGANPTSKNPAEDFDLVTAAGSVIACLSNIGPGVGDVGPTDNYAPIPWPGKLVLAACMLLGRLEIFTVLVLFFPSFWRK